VEYKSHGGRFPHVPDPQFCADENIAVKEVRIKPSLYISEELCHFNSTRKRNKSKKKVKYKGRKDRLCGLVVRVLGYRSGGLGSIPGTNRKKKQWVWNGVRSAS
jgi:hypothetical protein